MASVSRKKRVRSTWISTFPTSSRWTVRGSSVIAFAFVAKISTLTKSFSPPPVALSRCPRRKCVNQYAFCSTVGSEGICGGDSIRRRWSQPFSLPVGPGWSRRQSFKPPSSTLGVSTAASDTTSVHYAANVELNDSENHCKGISSGSNVGDERAETRENVRVAARNADTRPEVMVRPGDVLECWHAKTLVLGNYEGLLPERRALRLRTAAGEVLTIDAGQIVGVWSKDDVRGPVPSSTAEWMELQARARALLQSMPARGLDLGPFWKAANVGRKKILVTPAHAAEFLFSEGHAQVGLRKRKPFQFNRSEKTFVSTATQRAAATQVLTGELIRFKRVVSERVESPPMLGVEATAGEGSTGKALLMETATGGNGELLADEDLSGESETVLIQVGGFRAMDQSVAETREVMEFCRLVKAMKKHTSAAGEASESKGGRDEGEQSASNGLGLEAMATRAALFEPAYLLILHSLEAFALGGDERSIAPEARRALEKLGKVTPDHAKAVLLDVGLWTQRRAVGEPEEEQGEAGGGENRRGGNLASFAGVSARGVRAGDADAAPSGKPEASSPPEAGAGVGVVPWAADVLEAAAALGRERTRRAFNYKKRSPSSQVGAPAPFGRHDFRGAGSGVYCMDGDGTSFFDDAFSVDSDSGEIFVHITDVQTLVHQGSTLDEVARLRASSEYLPQGPLFMMPPTALKALSLSNTMPNEAVTVGFKVEPGTGRITSSRVMLTTLPPVRHLTFDEVDSVLEGFESAGEANVRVPVSGTTRSKGNARLEPFEREIRVLDHVTHLTAKGSGRGQHDREMLHLRTDKRGQVRVMGDPDSRARKLLNELLSVYSEVVYKLCGKAGVGMPTLIGQQNLLARGRSRCGTGPLRRYVDILAQRQIAAVLRGSGFLSKKYLMSTVSYLTWRHNKTRSRRDEEAGRLSLEALASHCRAQMKATGLKYAVVPARGTGKGREVRLDGLGVLVHVKRAPGKKGDRRGVAIAMGQRVKVMIERVAPHLKEVVATEFHDSEA